MHWNKRSAKQHTSQTFNCIILDKLTFAKSTGSSSHLQRLMCEFWKWLNDNFICIVHALHDYIKTGKVDITLKPCDPKSIKFSFH